MTLLSAKPTTDQAERDRDLSENYHVLPAPGPEKPVWVDLLGPSRPQLEEVRQTLSFSPEVITQCLLPAHTPKVVPIDSALFLVTFLGALSSQSLFALRALKICVAPSFLLTAHGRSTAALSLRRLRLPDLASASDGRTGRFLCLILEGAVQSYETIGAELRKRLPREPQRDPGSSQGERIWRQPEVGRKREQFAAFLRQQRVFLQDVVRAGSMLFAVDDRVRLQWLAERVGVLTRRVGEFVQTPRERRGRIEQELTVILTETEKQTALIGKQFSLMRFAEVDLSGAVFREADLEGTKFMKVDLRGADFRQANLQGAVFSLCDLHEADFTDARLEGANFRTSFGLSTAMWRYIRSCGGVV